MESSSVSAVPFVNDLRKVSDFYSKALGLKCTHSDDQHSVLNCYGFDLIVHQIPQQIADEISVENLPERRIWGKLRLNFPVRNVQECRRLASALGGQVDRAPPAWAGPNANVFLGCDPEGNVFKISEHAQVRSSRA